MTNINVYVLNIDNISVEPAISRAVSPRDTMRAVSWRYFLGAAILATGVLVKVGAPIPAVAAGVLLAALVNWSAERRARK